MDQLLPFTYSKGGVKTTTGLAWHVVIEFQMQFYTKKLETHPCMAPGEESHGI
jgi:hypothetical protein